MAALLCSLCTSNRPICEQKHRGEFSQSATYGNWYMHYLVGRKNQKFTWKKDTKFHMFATNNGSTKSHESEETVPSWARPDADEAPPWARDEASPNELKEGFEFPFIVYLLASAVTAIAAIGSVFEYSNQNPAFGVVNSDSIFYAPLLGFFAFTGIPTSVFLWFKSVEVANKEAEEQDRRDGFR